MKRCGVRPSVRQSVPFARCSSVQRVCCCGLGGYRKCRWIAARPAPQQQHEAATRRTAANAGSATFSAYLQGS